MEEGGNSLPTESQIKVALDTNMLLAIEQLGVDVFFQIEEMFGKDTETAIPKHVLEELRKFEEGKLGTETGIALEEIERHKAKVIEIDAENADNALEKMAKEGYIVASNDKVLRKRIKGFGGTVIYLRQSRFLKKD